MRKALKKELSIVCGLGAFACWLTGLKKPAAILTGLSAGLTLAPREQEYQWKGKSDLITGGSRGLGRGIAREAVSQGAKVTLVARKFEELANARQILISEYPYAEVCTVIADVTHKDQLENAFQEAKNAFGIIDVIVNNAGAISVGPFESTTLSDFEAQMKLHLYAVIESTQLILPHFLLRGGGRIINICSLGGRVAVPHMLPYDASKFALAGFSQGVATELARQNIIVTTVYPTLMKTGSPIQAVFKGDHEKEFAWFEAADNFPGITMSVASAAKKILQASADGDSELVPSILGRARILGSAVLPEIMNATMEIMANLMPRGQSGVRQTGHQSRALFDSSIVTRPLKGIAKRAQEDNNQTPSTDAEFNMGLH